MVLSLALIAGTLAVTQAPEIPPPSGQTLHRAEALAPFHARLRAPSGRPVHILQIGDSHTSADAISNGIRLPLQARFGNGGRGALAAGRPFANYVTWNVTASQSGGWTANSWTSGDAGSPPLGLSGFTQTARAAGETLGLAADAPEHEFDRVVLCALAQPGGGTIALRIGGEERRWSLDAPRRQPACHAVDSDSPVASVTVTTEDDGPVSITSIGAFRRRGGAVISNLGVIGAQLAHFGRSDERVLRAELRAYRPDLIILAFGTNEGFDRRVSPRDYEAGLRTQIARIRRLARGNVPILIVGAPDAASRNAEAAGGDCGGGHYTPRPLGEIRARQRAVARELGLAFWDWEAAMGGRCASRTWHAAGLMRDDHIHFTREGGDRIGRMLFDDLMRGVPL
ncbi:MAG TPA: GDSL-type esterase/lipase family protein [Allosphingosinicella sp.]|nr:GDSL-type esterase/lipase family protein [Allosphingosinicella sp.]